MNNKINNILLEVFLIIEDLNNLNIKFNFKTKK